MNGSCNKYNIGEEFVWKLPLSPQKSHSKVGAENWLKSRECFSLKLVVSLWKLLKIGKSNFKIVFKLKIYTC